MKGLTTEELIKAIKIEENFRPDNGLVWYMGSVYTQHPEGLSVAAIDAETLGAMLAANKVNFYAPIAHWHRISVIAEMPQTDHDFWMEIDNRMIDRCDGMIFPLMKNWEKSRGMAHEAARFISQGKPVLYWEVKQYNE